MLLGGYMKNIGKSLLIGIICLSCLCGCGKVPKLANGEEAVVTFKKGDTEYAISANDLYNELKDKYGLQATISMINTYILEEEFADYVEEAKASAENYIEAMIESFGDEDALLEALQSQTNYSTIEAYQDYLYMSFLESHALEEYAKGQITDEEIEKYYNEESKGDIEVYHILITPDVTDDMTSDEKTEAEDKAKEKVKEIINKLKEADDVLATFKTLAASESDDEATKDDGGNLGYINYGVLSDEYDELVEAAYKLKDGEYSTSVITTELGYHVIYRNASKEKDSLDNLKEDIIKTLADELMETDEEISINSMKYYQKLYNMEIIDSTLNKQYGIYLNNLINSISSTDE